MPPRISLRRSFIYLLGITCFLFLAINVHQKEIWDRSLAAQLTRPTEAVTEDNADEDDNDNEVDSVLKEDGEPLPSIGPRGAPLTPSHADYSERPWYMMHGSRRPKPAARNKKTNKRVAKLWPHEDQNTDRITNQLMFVPPVFGGEDDFPVIADSVPLKKILMFNGLSSWAPLTAGREVFTKNHCPVDTCTITTNKDEAKDADAVLFKDHFGMTGLRRPPRQVWILYLLECPYHTPHFASYHDVFNWTATYRWDSDIVAPYERWAYYDERVKLKPQPINYAANKTKQVAWFVSNCAARNGRLQYAHELQKYINVDIYGSCGTKRCPRVRQDECFKLLDREYKFYLAFENSNCKDYITEKFFVNGLG